MEDFFIKVILFILLLFLLSAIFSSSQEQESMVVFFFKLIFLTVSAISNMISRVIFSALAQVIVLMVNSFKGSGEVTKGVLSQATDLIRSIFEYIIGFIIDAINNIITTIFDAIKDGIFEAFTLTTSTIGEIMENTRNSMADLFSDIPEVVNGFSEMITTMISDLWSNCMEALGYIKENA
ncbi:hypothetical protein Ancab_019931 [Ancistrocladus abbreviatus]